MSARQKASSTRAKTNTEASAFGCGHLGCCSNCASKRQPAGRRKIKQISEPLRPDQLGQILAQYGLVDEHSMPSAWLGPYPQNTTAADLTRPPFVSSSLLSASEIGPPSSVVFQTPFADQRVQTFDGQLGSLVPSFPSVPLTIYQPSVGPTRAAHSDDASHSPLAYSLSAELASVGKHRFRLTYVTDRLLVVSYPPDSQESDHNEGARWLCQAFERRYGQNYRIFNLSGFTKELHLSSQAPVIDLFWPAPLAPGLEQLVTAIDQLDYWLHNHDNGFAGAVLSGQDVTTAPPSNRVAVLHCTGPKSLLATYLAVYICQSKARFGPMCGQRPGSPTARGLRWNENRFRRFRNELVLGHMIMKRFYEDNLASELNPSQKRYVGYFSGLVTGALILQDRLVYLHAVVYRNPSRGRFFTTALETITEANNNGNGNSVYARPDEVLMIPPAEVQTSTFRYDEAWGPETSDQFNLINWCALSGLGDIRDFEYGTFPTDHEQLNHLTRSIDTDIPARRGPSAITSADDLYRRGVHATVRSFIEGEGGLLLKIYQNLKLMHTTRLLCPNLNFSVEKYIFPIEPVLPLHGDILIACYLRPDITVNVQEIVFRLQFHTCATSSDKLNFYKHDLDEACKDTRFPPTGCVELHFSANPELFQEHNDNIRRGGYTWTSTDRESSILGIASVSGRRRPARVYPVRGAPISGEVRYPTEAYTATEPTPPPLSIFITTQEYVFSAPSALIPGGVEPTPSRMWPDTGASGRPDDRLSRIPLIRQISDPLSQPTVRGRSLPTQWSPYLEPGRVQQAYPSLQQTLLSPRLGQVGATGASTLGYPSPITNGAGGITGQIGRLNLAQLQSLYQQLLQQQQQQQQQPPQQPQPVDRPGDSGLYATVQRPAGANLINLLSNVQKAIAQQQQQQLQQRQTAVPASYQYSQPAGVMPNAAQLLSGLSSSTALTNLARALLPSVTAPVISPGDTLTSPRQQPFVSAQAAAAPQSVQRTPYGLSYVPVQPRLSATITGTAPVQQPLPLLDPEQERLYLELLAARTSASLQPTTMAKLQAMLAAEPSLHTMEHLSDSRALTEQRRRAQLQRARLMLNDQERRLFDELRALRQRRAGLLSRQEQYSRLSVGEGVSGITPLESYRRATGRVLGTSDGGMRGRGPTRVPHEWGRSESADAARIGHGEFYDWEQSEDDALLALLEQRLERQALSETDGRMPSHEDIPLRAVGPQQRSGHVVDGSSQAIHGEFAPGGAVRVFLPSESQSRQPTPRAEVPPTGPGPGSGGYAALSDLSLLSDGVVQPRPFVPTSRPNGEFERAYGPRQRQPRIQLPTAAPEDRYSVHGFGTSGMARTISGSPSPHLMPSYPGRGAQTNFAPAHQERQWYQGGYEDQLTRPADRYHSDLSPGVSPVRTPSARLLRSPVSPPLRPRGHDRRYPGSALDTGSQSDTGLLWDAGGRSGYYGSSWSTHEQPIRRGYRPWRGGRTDVSSHRGHPVYERGVHSPTVVRGSGESVRFGPLDHVPESALITLNRLSASTHIWYRPEMSRTQSIDLVRADPPGTFVVRNSGSFPHSFGLVVKVSRQRTMDATDESSLVRHYLIEGVPPSATVMSQAVGVTAASLAPSSVPMGPAAMSVTQGPVLLRGCPNEPIFTNMISLLYEHVVQPLALPVVLRLPFKSSIPTSSLPSLIQLSGRSAGRLEQTGYTSRGQRSHLGGYTSRESPRGPSHRALDSSRRPLTRQPSDPLPGDGTASAMGPYYPSHTHTRHNGSAPPESGAPHHQGYPLVSPYETEHGPVSGHTGRWRTFTSVYLGSIDTENLTGVSAIRKAVDVLMENAAQVRQTEVTIKVSQDGLTVTDNWRKLFFRRHYPFFSVSHCAIDPQHRCWESNELHSMGIKSSRIFGFVARKQNTRENMCHVLCDTPECSATTITEYIMRRLNEY